ncbi:MAG: hypothetical protein WAW92_01615 [Minisyncoccia bacterium]
MKKAVYASLAFAPVLAMAQSNFGSLTSIVDFVVVTVGRLIPVFFGLAIIYFFWGLIKFLQAAGDPKAQENGRNMMIWGVITIAVMLSVYGLTIWLRTLFGIGNQTSLPIPTVPGLQ